MAEINIDAMKMMLFDMNPYAKKTGFDLLEAAPNRVKLSFPRDPKNFNPFGSYHAGALFTFGETCAGAVLAVSLDFSKYQLLVKYAEIEYVKQAFDEIYCEATMSVEEAEEIAKRIDEEERITLPVTVEFTDKDGDVTTKVTPHFYIRKRKA